MKYLILSLTLLVSNLHILTAQNSYDITVHFNNFSSNNGKLFVGLYDSKAHFLEKRFVSKKTEINNLQATIVFKNIPSGTYAISAYQDENNNDKMDAKFFVIPKEPIGISNNAKGKYGPPKFEDASFLLDTHKELNIRMSEL